MEQYQLERYKGSIVKNETKMILPWNRRRAPWLRLGNRLLLAVSIAVVGEKVLSEDHDAFRVCADPNYLPYSSRSEDGFENKLAELLAKDLGLRVEYTWFPQRMGFIRNTLRARDPVKDRYKCDVVMGVPDGFELAITTDPYYRSTYAIVYVKGRDLDDIKMGDDLVNLQDARKDTLRIGVSERSPGAQWLAKYGMFEQMKPYIAQSGDPNERPGELMENDLRSGDIDAAILWGPIAGFIATRSKNGEFRVIPLRSEHDVKFHYAISAGVRFGETDWKNKINDILKRDSAKIEALLNEYNVPLVDDAGVPLAKVP